MDAPVDDLLRIVPTVLHQLTSELVRRGDECLIASPESQLSACFLLGLRALSLINGMESVLRPELRDSFEVLARAHLEARDLLMTFRFDDESARRKIRYWFAGRADNAWKAEHTKVEQFLTRHGAMNIELAANWSRITALAHPTKYASEHSTAVITSRLTGRSATEDFTHKKADYLLVISRFSAAVTLELQGWVPLGCDISRMPTVLPFHEEVERVALPILNAPPGRSLPRESYRS